MCPFIPEDVEKENKETGEMVKVPKFVPRTDYEEMKSNCENYGVETVKRIIEKERPDIEFRKLEVSKSPENLAVFRKKMEKLGVKGGGVPTFIFKDKPLIGFRKGVFEEKIRAMIGKPVKKPVKK